MNLMDKVLLKLADEISQHILTISDENKRIEELHESVQHVYNELRTDDIPKDQAEITSQFLFSCVVAKIKPHDPALDEFVDEMVAQLQMIDPKYRPVYIGNAIEKIMPLAKHELGSIILRLTKRLQKIDEIKGYT